MPVLFALDLVEQYKGYDRNCHVLIIWTLIVTLTSEISKPIFDCMTLRLVIMHHHSKLGHKRFSALEGTVRTKHGHTNRRTNDFSILPFHPNFVRQGREVIINHCLFHYYCYLWVNFHQVVAVSNLNLNWTLSYDMCSFSIVAHQ